MLKKLSTLPFTGTAEQKAKLAKEAAAQYRESQPLPIERDRLPGEAEEQALHQKVEECQKELRETVSRLQDLQRENAGYATLAARLPDIRQKLTDVSEALAVAKENYRVVMATMAYLEQARAQLTASYLDQVQEKFAYYVGQMSRIDPALATDRFKLTPSFEVTVVESGASHAESTVSRGTRDLLALSLRLALRDAIFDKEEPPLLLDDPFIAFDEERIGAALGCLKSIAETKQIIYFTCHESRI